MHSLSTNCTGYWQLQSAAGEDDAALLEALRTREIELKEHQLKESHLAERLQRLTDERHALEDAHRAGDVTRQGAQTACGEWRCACAKLLPVANVQPPRGFAAVTTDSRRAALTEIMAKETAEAQAEMARLRDAIAKRNAVSLQLETC